MKNFVEVSILDIVGRCGIWTKQNSNSEEIRARCPFCGGGRKEKPTASVNIKRNLFYCHRCGEGHNSLTLYAKLTGIGTKDAYREFAQTLYEAA